MNGELKMIVWFPRWIALLLLVLPLVAAVERGPISWLRRCGDSKNDKLEGSWKAVAAVQNGQAGRHRGVAAGNGDARHGMCLRKKRASLSTDQTSISERRTLLN